jgi:hypothetical protein
MERDNGKWASRNVNCGSRQTPFHSPVKQGAFEISSWRIGGTTGNAQIGEDCC